jgi:hypothetical protein
MGSYPPAQAAKLPHRDTVLKARNAGEAAAMLAEVPLTGDPIDLIGRDTLLPLKIN